MMDLQAKKRIFAELKNLAAANEGSHGSLTITKAQFLFIKGEGGSIKGEEQKAGSYRVSAPDFCRLMKEVPEAPPESPAPKPESKTPEPPTPPDPPKDQPAPEVPKDETKPNKPKK